jgi:predicted MFS family arabinose efflux permease
MNRQHPVPDPAAGGAAATRDAYRTYVLAALSVVCFMQNVDRVVIFMFLQPIKQEFMLTDTQVGLISGAAFAITQGLMAVPVARLADAGNRKWVIGACFAFWSALTALSGAATGFISMMLARIGVGAGEAGCGPAAHSMLGDYYERALRSRALAVISAFTALGGMVGMAGGGFLAQTVGWRNGFFILGVLGLVLAVVFHLTVREPHRTDERPKGDGPKPKLLDQLGDLRSFGLLALAMALATLTGAAVAWLPSYFARTFSMTQAQIGVGVGLSVGFPFAIGTILGGQVSMRWVARSRSWGLRFGAGTLACGLPFYVATYFMPSPLPAFACLFVAMVLLSAAAGPVLLAVQDLVEPRARATASALLGVAASIVGQGLGPVLIGAVSDWMARADPSANSLRLALVSVSLPLLLTSALYVALARRIDAMDTSTSRPARPS